MDENQKKQLIFLGVAVAAFAIVQISMHMPKGDNVEISGIGSGSAPTAIKDQSSIVVEPIGKGVMAYGGRNYRIPFDNKIALGLVVKEEKKQVAVRQEGSFSKDQFKVSAIVWGTDRPQTIINGELYEVGDVVKGAKITDIDKAGIHVFHGDREHVLIIER
ncbi:MAG: hypothetical protein ABH825_03135 [Candidatus Omnitrophota bacterium]